MKSIRFVNVKTVRHPQDLDFLNRASSFVDEYTTINVRFRSVASTIFGAERETAQPTRQRPPAYFTIAERVFGGKSIIERELETNTHSEQRQILEAYHSGYTSLFEITASYPEKATIQLHDLLRDEDKEILDVNLSRCAEPSYGLSPIVF